MSILRIEDYYGDYAVLADAVMYTSLQGNKAGILTGERLWRLSFGTSEEAQAAIKMVHNHLEYDPFMVEASRWKHYLDLDAITSLGPVQESVRSEYRFYVILETGAIKLTDTRSNLLDARSMILDAWEELTCAN